MKLSVIIPIYKAEKYIKRCVESLFMQTLVNIEYIFVDDASPDNSISILKSELEKYHYRKSQTIILSNDVNMGASYARNRGLDVCTGDYVTFCDADDIVQKDAYEQMMGLAVSQKVDVVSCGMCVVKDNKREFLLYREGYSSVLSATTSLREIEGTLYSSLCNRIIAVELFKKNNIKFNDKFRMWDDLYVSFLVRYYSKSGAIINQPFYYYIMNGNSIISENISIKYNSQIECAKLLEQFLYEKNEKRYGKVLSFIKFHSKDLMFDSGDIYHWRHTFSETHRHLFSFIEFYGLARLIRYGIVILGGQLGWKLLSLYSHIKNNY